MSRNSAQRRRISRDNTLGRLPRIIRTGRMILPHRWCRGRILLDCKSTTAAPPVPRCRYFRWIASSDTRSRRAPWFRAAPRSRPVHCRNAIGARQREPALSRATLCAPVAQHAVPSNPTSDRPHAFVPRCLIRSHDPGAGSGYFGSNGRRFDSGRMRTPRRSRARSSAVEHLTIISRPSVPGRRSIIHHTYASQPVALSKSAGLFNNSQMQGGQAGANEASVRTSQ